MSSLSILLLGNTDRTEFQDARRGLSRWGSVEDFADIDSAAAALAEGAIAPDVMVVAQAFPGQFSRHAIDRLRQLAPLMRLVGLMGSWCEGEMRSGSPWPGAMRTYWHQWTARCNRELQRMAQGACCSWTLPPTATEEERLLANAAERWPTRQGLVLIHAWRRETADWLSAACRSRGFATVWQRAASTARVEGARAALFDGTDLGVEECGVLRVLAASLYPAPVIALLGFPRVEDRQRALSAGAAALLSKPLSVEDLWGELERVDSGQWSVVSGQWSERRVPRCLTGG